VAEDLEDIFAGWTGRDVVIASKATTGDFQSPFERLWRLARTALDVIAGWTTRDALFASQAISGGCLSTSPSDQSTFPSGQVGGDGRLA
jgi:hypothetical protein